MYKFAGRQREMGLGSAQDVPLAKARALAMAARRALADCKDPSSLRKKVETPTFGACADELIDSMEPFWRNVKHRYQWRQTLGVQYVASLRKMPVDQVTTEQILEVLKPIWIGKAETAVRLRGRIERILDAAKAKGYRSGENPARWRGHLANLLPKRHKLTRGHHAAMAIDEVPAFLQELRASQGISARALEFTVLTAARTGEVQGARWPEIDLKRDLWVIPGERTKAGVEHRVPLANRVKSILVDMERIKTGPVIFPGNKADRPLSNMAMTMLLRRQSGFRTTPVMS
jgi:integrase